MDPFERKGYEIAKNNNEQVNKAFQESITHFIN